MCLESTDEIMAITHAHPCFPADNHFEQSIPWITDVYFGIVTCPASAFVFPISSHLQIPNKSLYLYRCEGWFFGIASFLFIFEGVRYFSGMFPTKTDWPDLWAAAIFENNNCHVSVRSASNQFTTIRNVDSHLKSPIRSYLLFEYIADRNSPKCGLSTSGVLVYPYPEQHKTLPPQFELFSYIYFLLPEV